MNVNVVILPFDEVPEECKFYNSCGVNVCGIYKCKWDKVYKVSVQGNLIADLKDFDVVEGLVCVQDEEDSLYFWIDFGCIDLKRTVLCKEILQYLVNYF